VIISVSLESFHEDFSALGRNDQKIDYGKTKIYRIFAKERIRFILCKARRRFSLAKTSFPPAKYGSENGVGFPL
jgi:hypothetical protein